MTVVAGNARPQLSALYFDRWYWLDHGSIFADGTPDTVITKEIIRKVFFAMVDVSQHPRSHVPQNCNVAGRYPA